MHRYSYIFLILIPIIFTSCGSSKNTASAIKAEPWQETPIVIDGQNLDWPNPYPLYDEKSKISYATSNDGENLYISMQTGDEATEMKILRAGMTLYIDPTGGRDQSVSVQYPMAGNTTDIGTWKPRSENNQFSKGRAEHMQKLIESSRDIAFQGFKNNCNGATAVMQQNDCGIVVRMDMDEYQSLIWEIKIPFKSFYKDRLSPEDMGKPIGICFAINAIPKPAEKKDDNPNGANHGGMQGMQGMGGGMRGGRGAAYTGDYLHEHTKTWIKAGLAYKS